jgi:lipopolysaccharide exporter
MTAASLASRAQKAVKWSAMATAARFVLQLGAQVALARVLGPGNDGVYGIGIAVLTFSAFLAGSAFSYSLLLQERVEPEDIRFAFTWQLLAGSAMALAMSLGAPALADFFGDARVEAMVRWLALACVLSAASAPATCLLQRDLNFRALSLVQLASYAAGYLAVGLPLALAGWGAQALAMACVVQAGVTLVGAYAVHPHPLRPLWRHAGAAHALSTGRTVFFTNVVNWLLGNLEGRDRRIPQSAQGPLETAAAGHHGRPEGPSQLSGARIPGQLDRTHPNRIPAALRPGPATD